MASNSTGDSLISITDDILDNNGPEHEDFDRVMELIDQLPAGDVELFRQAMQPVLHPGTIIGFSYTKPFGYNGDFFIIEKIYQRYVSDDPRYEKWDRFFHRLPAAIAVVNRKVLAVKMLKQLQEEAKGEKKHVLILGSGPVTEVNEYLNDTPANTLQFDLIDLDQRAIDYARQKNKAYLDYLNFANKNVIRFTPEKKYDLIWSAGLFDYFKDKHFVFLLKRYYEYIAPGGKMVIGNFSTENPSKKIMEVLGDWFLYHRSEEELRQFAFRAGIDPGFVKVISEPLGINLFLKVQKPV